jgi:hypothetical protein
MKYRLALRLSSKHSSFTQMIVLMKIVCCLIAALLFPPSAIISSIFFFISILRFLPPGANGEIPDSGVAKSAITPDSLNVARQGQRRSCPDLSETQTSGLFEFHGEGIGGREVEEKLFFCKSGGLASPICRKGATQALVP